MYPGFEFNQGSKPLPGEYQQQRFTEPEKNFAMSSENKNPYNFKPSSFEEQPEGYQIPSQILELFESKDQAHPENKNKQAARNPAPNRNPDTRVPLGTSTLNFNNPTTTGGTPHSSMSPNDSGLRFQSFNTLLNQSNDYMMMNKASQQDLNTSNMSNKDRKMSMNNLSRDSRNDSLMDLNTSNRKNSSSRAHPKTSKNYQVTLNEDISLIERIEILLNQITMNHNKACPFCSKIIDIKKCNFQNISALLSNTSKKYYLTHFDCYLKSNSNPSSAKIVPLSGIIEARVNSQINSLSHIDTSNFLRSDRRAYFVSIEGYHPISSFLFFRIDKICHGLEHASHRNQLLYMNLANKTTSIFEPSSYMIPFSEFRLVITIHMSHANEDPYTYEYLVDFSQVKLSADQKNRFAEILCIQEGNNILIASQIVYDPTSELANLNKTSPHDTSFQNTSVTSSGPSKPDFGKNIFISFKHFSINLPLRRVERRTKDLVQAVAAPVIEENLFTQVTKQSTPVSQGTGSSQKKSHTRLRLNPDAPLFSAIPQTPAQTQPQTQTEQPQYNQMRQMQQQQQQPQGGYNKQGFQGQQQERGYQQQNYENPQYNQKSYQQGGSNVYFNNPSNFPGNILPEHQHQQQQQQGGDFKQQQQFPQGARGQGQAQYQPPSGTGQEDFIPPGLGLSHFNQQQKFMGQQGGGAMKGSQGYEQRSGEEQYEEHDPRQNILPPEINLEEELQEGLQLEGEQRQQTETAAPSILKRGRENRPANLYTAVLSGRVKEESATNSPSLQNLQNKYFSGVSTPRSAQEPSLDTPLSQSNQDFLGEEATGQPLNEEMIENFQLEEHLGELVEFAKTYNGSRILQKFFPKANQNQVELVIQEIKDKLEELMLDPYANYMFQTLAQSCSGDQRYFLLKKISPSMLEIACDKKGTHSLQALIALVSRDAEEQLLRETLQNHIVELSFDPQGTHLVQKLIVSISLNNIDFIFNPLVNRFMEVANNSLSLCVLKQLITKVDKAPELKRKIIQLLYENLENLIQNPYGNYALQHALDIYQTDCNSFFEKTFDKIVQYSNQKFSSNVIEKCLVLTTPEYKKKFVREIVQNDRIIELMKNKYGNFVLLKALKSVDTECRQILMQSLIRNVNAVNMAKYKNSWIKFIEENPLRIPGMNVAQPIKPSLFKHNSGQSEGAEAKSVESWDEQRAKGGMKDERSQFAYGKPKQDMRSQSDDPMKGGLVLGGLEAEETGEEERRNYKENVLEGQMGPMAMEKGMMQQGAAGKKVGKAPNQKFYDDKNLHYANKQQWGFNNFY